MDTQGDHFVHLADLGDLTAARLCAAVLADADIESRVHGESLGPYPMTVGRMAVTQIWVRESDVVEAAEVMLEAEIDHTLGVEMNTSAVLHPGSLPMRLAAVAVAAILVLAVVRELMRVF